MAGNSSITGNQTVTFTDNMSFDGTDRGGAMNTDGQLWIGSTSSNRANDGGHVRLGSLTSPNGTIDIGYSAPNITLDVIDGFVYTNVIFAASPYTVIPNDYYISCNTSGGAITLRFPNTPPQYQRWIVKDRTGNAAANNITITTVGGAVNIDGAVSYAIASNYGSVQLLFNGLTYEIF